MSDVFICYSHQNKKWHDEVRQHLKALETYEQIVSFSDVDLEIGEDWRLRILNEIDLARTGILLVSAQFLSSNFITRVELPKLIQNRGRGMKIYTIFAAPCNIHVVPELSRYQAMNSPESPLSGMSKTKRETLYSRLSQDIFRRQQPRVGDEPQLRDDKLPEMNYAEIKGVQTFQNLRISLPRMIYELGTNYLEGYSFDRCQIVGPSIITYHSGLMSGIEFSVPEGETLLYQCKSEWVTGVIRMDHCNFTRCSLHNVGFIDRADLRAKLLGVPHQ